MLNRKRFFLCVAVALFVTSGALFLVGIFTGDRLEVGPEELAQNARFVREQTPGWDEHSASLVQTAADAFRVPFETAQDPPEGDPTQDGATAWQKYPRTGFAFTKEVWTSPLSFSADKLFRNKELNPVDTVLSLQAQTRLKVLVEDGGPKLRDLRYLAHGHSILELSTLIDAKRARHVSYHDYLDRLSEKDREAVRAQKARKLAEQVESGMSLEEATDFADRTRIILSGHPVFPFKVFAERYAGDGFYAAEIEELPLTEQTMAAWRASVVEFAYQVLYVFRSESCYDQERMTSLLGMVQVNK